MDKTMGCFIIIIGLFSMVGNIRCDCGSDESAMQGVVEQYVLGSLIAVTDIQVSCPNSFPSEACTSFSNFIDDLIALNVDGQCLLDAYDYFETIQSDPNNGIQCSFEDIVELCPDATNLDYAVDGGYGSWSEWSCDCDSNTETKTRSCDTPPPTNDGLTCEEQGLGDSEETQDCTSEMDCDEENSSNSLKGEYYKMVLAVTSALYFVVKFTKTF